MVKIYVTDRLGREQLVESPVGRSLMEALRDNGVDEILALCGGCRSCGTCHVYIDQGFAPLLPLQSEEEAELLDGSIHVTERSRLSCQIPLTTALDGLRLDIPPED
jgi:ferredoxin, 2Fe-2S